MGGSSITIEGIPPGILTNAQNFAGQSLTLHAGLGPGLPLAKPKQAGLIIQATILQAFGDWVGTHFAISFVIYPGFYTTEHPGNFVLNWRAGTLLSVALKNTLQVAYPGTQININIADTVLSHDEIHVCSTLSGLGRLLYNITPSHVQIWQIGQAILVSDDSETPTPKPLNFEDMIGQPMWIEANTIQARFALRADLTPGDVIDFPQASTPLPGFVRTAISAIPSAKNYQSAIQGEFTVQSLRHIGNLRQPNGNAWCTVVNAAVKPTPSNAVAQVT